MRVYMILMVFLIRVAAKFSGAQVEKSRVHGEYNGLGTKLVITHKHLVIDIVISDTAHTEVAYHYE